MEICGIPIPEEGWCWRKAVAIIQKPNLFPGH